MKKLSLGELTSLTRAEMKKIMAGSGWFKCCIGTNCSNCTFVPTGVQATCPDKNAVITGC